MTLSDMTAWFADGLYHRLWFPAFVDVVSFGLNGGLLVQAAHFTHTSNMRFLLKSGRMHGLDVRHRFLVGRGRRESTERWQRERWFVLKDRDAAQTRGVQSK